MADSRAPTLIIAAVTEAGTRSSRRATEGTRAAGGRKRSKVACQKPMTNLFLTPPSHTLSSAVSCRNIICHKLLRDFGSCVSALSAASWH
jgi:hypothetical protein